jgi:2-hydroxychromene-2-carboxylate isomerase
VGELILMETLMAARSAVASVRLDSRSVALSGGEGPRSAARSAVAPAPEPVADRRAFYFDLACPFSYLAAERVERLLGDVDWVPVPGSRGDTESIIARADALARAARLPLVWPERFPASLPRAMRAAAYTAEIGVGPRFALAAFRLAFCGGFDLEKASVLTDVASAAGISARDCLVAAAEEWRDEELRATASALSAQGVLELPVIGVEGRWFDGLAGLTEAAAWIRRG